MSNDGKGRWGAKTWALVITVLMLGSAFGGVKWAEATLPTQDGTWGEWFRETYGWFTTALHLDYLTTSGGVLYGNSGDNVTQSSVVTVDSTGLESSQWVNSTVGMSTDALYANSERITAMLPYSYIVNATGATYYAKNCKTGEITSNTNATLLLSGISSSNTHILLKNSINFGASKLILTYNNYILEGAHENITLTFTGANGVEIGKSSGGATEYQKIFLKNLKILGDNSTGSLGIRRTNNKYSLIENVEINNFRKGFLEESYDTGINVLNFGVNINIIDCLIGAEWGRRDIVGAGGNNLNIYYGLNCYGPTAKPVGSIGYNHLGGETNIVFGGLAERYDLGIFVNASTGIQFEKIWTENNAQHIQLGSTAVSCEIDTIMVWGAGETKYTDAGTFNNIKISRTSETYYLGKTIVLDGYYAMKTGTGVIRQGADADLYIGHDGADNLIINLPSGKATSYRVNGAGLWTILSDGTFMPLKIRNKGIDVTVTETNTSITVSFPTSESDVYYGVVVMPSWNTTIWYSSKNVGNVTINFGTAAPASAKIDWHLYR